MATSFAKLRSALRWQPAETCQHVRELVARQLIQRATSACSRATRAGVVAPGQEARDRRDLAERRGAWSRVGIGSRSTIAVVTCVVTRSRTR